eukprot:11316000-Heterocapsa_arctica.AAC.1
MYTRRPRLQWMHRQPKRWVLFWPNSSMRQLADSLRGCVGCRHVMLSVGSSQSQNGYRHSYIFSEDEFARMRSV